MALPCPSCACTLHELVCSDGAWHWQCPYCRKANDAPVPIRYSRVFGKFRVPSYFAESWLDGLDVKDATEGYP